MTAVALRAELLTHPPTPSLCPRLRCASLRGLGHPRKWMATRIGRRGRSGHRFRYGLLRCNGRFRCGAGSASGTASAAGACGAPLPLRAVGTFLRFVRCGPRWGSHSTTLRKEPTSTPLQSSPATPTPLQRSPTHLPAPPLQPPSPLHSLSAPAQPYALPALFLPPLTPLRGEEGNR